MYPEGTRTDAAGDLVFKARFRPRIVQTLVILAKRLASNKPGLLGSPWTYPVLLAALFLSLVGTSCMLFRTPEADLVPRDTNSDLAEAAMEEQVDL